MNTAHYLSMEDIHENMSVSFDCPLTQDMLDDFADFSLDKSPIHMNDATAKTHGFKTRVIHGAIFNALFSRLIGMYCPGQLAVLHSLNAKYHKPSYPGDEVVVSGTVEFVSVENRTITMALTVRNKEDGEIRVKAKAQIGILREG